MNRLLVILLFLGSAVASANERSILRMKVEHLACSECAEKFRRDLSSLCKDLVIDVPKGEAVCKYDAPTSPKEILKRANKSGLRTSKID